MRHSHCRWAGRPVSSGRSEGQGDGHGWEITRADQLLKFSATHLPDKLSVGVYLQLVQNFTAPLEIPGRLGPLFLEIPTEGRYLVQGSHDSDSKILWVCFDYNVNISGNLAHITSNSVQLNRIEMLNGLTANELLIPKI